MGLSSTASIATSSSWEWRATAGSSHGNAIASSAPPTPPTMAGARAPNPSSNAPAAALEMISRTHKQWGMQPPAVPACAQVARVRNNNGI